VGQENVGRYADEIGARIGFRGSADRGDPVSVQERHLRSRGPSGPPRSGKSGNKAALLSRQPVTYQRALLTGSVITHDPVSVARPFAEAWPDAGRSQEREIRGSAAGARFYLCGGTIPAEPWPDVARSGESGKTGSTFVETTGHRRCAL